MSKLYDKRIVPTHPEYGASKRPLRQPTAPSYDVTSGRSHSSVDEQDSSRSAKAPREAAELFI